MPETDREEWLAAITPTADCYRHTWAKNRLGGGTCTVCGATVEADEL